MRIRDLLNDDNVVVSLNGRKKSAVISSMLDLLADNPDVVDPAGVKSAVLAREELMSTGVGKGLALPHAKTTGVQKTIAALAVTSRPIEFDAADGEPVRIVFLLVGPPDAKSNHVRILSRISRLMNREEVRSGVLACESPRELLDLIDRYEKQLIPN
jgi:mannitol/fructose-specific phosphotransferase system IIA component (Ntr-type)